MAEQEKLKEEKEVDAKRARLQKLARYYYIRKEIQQAIFSFSKNKEIVPRYYEQFGKRPDALEYETDVENLSLKGATSFHCSEEIWKNPLEIETGSSTEKLNNLRIGWDLLLDIDCKFIEYGKIATWLLTEALYFHGIRNFGVKFSGSKGFHIGLGFEAFPKNINGVDIKDYFPQGPRLIAAYLKEMIRKGLRERILEINTINEIEKFTGIPKNRLLVNNELDPFSVLEIDTVLISSRHLYRMPYSLNEKTGLASIVIKPEQIKSFHPGWAYPDRIFPKLFLPKPEQNEAKELMLQALDWQKNQDKINPRKLSSNKEKKDYEEIIITEVKEENFPPCIKNILSGLKQDGRKRSLFVLLNFLKSLGLNHEQIKEKVIEWNKKNYKPLKETYFLTQLSWFEKQIKKMPPNCELQSYYQDTGICTPDNLCAKIKNPLNYFILKSMSAKRAENFKFGGKFQKKDYFQKEKKINSNLKKPLCKKKKDVINGEKKEYTELPSYRQESYVKYKNR